MVLDSLREGIKQSLAKLTSALFIDETVMQQFIKDVQRSLLVADVQVQLVFDLTKKLKDRVKNESTPKNLSKKDHIVSILYEELTAIMGSGNAQLTLKYTPHIIMLVGLFGTGKTTTAAKLAKYFTKRAKRVCLISLDTYRPAAYEQLKQLGEKIGVPVFGDPKRSSAIAVYDAYDKEFSRFDVVIVDTAGRDALNEELVSEIVDIKERVKPHDTILVMNADIGQSAKAIASSFHEHCGVSGVIISKLDGTAKGGGALTACSVTKAPVLFIGVGEKIDDFEAFKPQNFVGQLLGMGDLESLLAKAQDAMSEDKAQALSKRLVSGEFTLLDLYEQMQAMKKMGPLNKVLELIPGFSSAQLPKEALAVQEEKMVIWKYIMDSCTRAELSDPSIMDQDRVERIAQGSGQSQSDVRELLKHYKQSKKMVRMFKGLPTEDKDMSEKDMKKMMMKMRNMKGVMKQMGR